MTLTDKNLLLKDLCARLPYGVKGINENAIISSPKAWKTEYTLEFAFLYRIEKYNWRPYLFPLSSMSEEQVKEYETMYEENRYSWRENIIDWFNKNHFDYRGLIEKGLAIDATGLNIY